MLAILAQVRSLHLSCIRTPGIAASHVNLFSDSSGRVIHQSQTLGIAALHVNSFSDSSSCTIEGERKKAREFAVTKLQRLC